MNKKSDINDSGGQSDNEDTKNKHVSWYKDEDSKRGNDSECEEKEGTKDVEETESKDEREYENEEDIKSKTESLDKDEEYIKSKKENEYKDEEDTMSEKESENEDEQDSKSYKENEYKEEEDTWIKNERNESDSQKVKGESKAKHTSNGQVRKMSSPKNKLSFLSIFARKSDDGETDGESEGGMQESSEQGRRKSSSKKKRTSSIVSLFSLNVKKDKSKKSDSQDHGRESDDYLKRDEQAKRNTDSSGKSSDSEKEDRRPGRSRRTSLMKKKFLALEMELRDENVHKKVTSIFSPVSDRSSDDESKDSVHEPRRVYLSSAMAAMFIISASTGGAISSMSFFLMQSSWFGIFLILLLGFNALYSGLCIGWSWAIMEKVWPEYLEYKRVPYQDIAHRAVGSWMKHTVAICVDITLLFICACCLVFVADAFGRASGNPSLVCITVITTVILLLPFSFFGNYSDMKFIGVTDVILSISYTIFIIICIFLDKPSHGPVVYSDPTTSSGVVAFAGMSFAYGVGAITPSILSEMADRKMFTHTCVTAYMVILAMYVVLPILGYAAYGDDTPTSIMFHIYENKKLYYFAVFIDCVNIVQLSTTFLLAILPTMHAFEERFHCPQRFCVVRVCIRVTLFFFILLLVLAVPYLPRFMIFVGATTMNLLTFILPPIFYVCLVYKKRSKSSKSEMNKRAWILIVEIVLLGMVIGAISMYVSVEHYVNTPITPRTCFANMTARLLTEGERVS